jgi:hypothetical protein
MCSFCASPLPSAAQKRPGNIAARVAIACAMIAGWYRCPGALTMPNGRLVVARAAPSQAHANPLWPWRALQGEKWSEHIAAVKPADSASRTASSRAAGCTCSWEAWKPMTVMPVALPARGARRHTARR